MKYTSDSAEDVNSSMNNNVRKEIKQKIKSSTIEYRKEASEIITEKLFALDEYKNAKTIFVYNSVFEEVDTSLIIKNALRQGKIVCLPRVNGDNMNAVRIDESTKYELSVYNIGEPVSGDIIDKIDLSIIPLVAFDEQKHRLGHGKGYYDRFLSTHDCIKIALAFSIQKTSYIEISKSDVDMDMIITEKEVCK